MAPATRRSSGLGGNANGPSNLDHILEHFNQFKRKHIAQNRDIIKTNALAQLRIKELEEKVLLVEADRAACKLDTIRMQRRLEQAEKASQSVRRGWQVIGAGIAALSAIDGFDLAKGMQPSDSRGAFTQQGTPNSEVHLDAAHLRPSARITLDPNALPAGVARNVARAPEACLNDVIEEEDTIADQAFDPDATREVNSDEERDDDGYSKHGEGNTISFSVDEEETIRMNVQLSPQTATRSPLTAEELGTASPVRYGAAQDALAQQERTRTSYVGQSNGLASTSRPLQRMTSIDSLSSFADEEEIELSTDDDEIRNVTTRFQASSLSHPRDASDLTSEDQAEQSVDASASRVKCVARKRKQPASPEDVRLVQRAAASSSRRARSSNVEDEDGYASNTSQSDDGTLSASLSPASRHSRRSSMRDRKSVNYALPKLNTKMRKPDPVDLVPAVRSESPRRSPGDATTAAVTDDAASSADDEPARRSLKGKHEVASTGNLRDLRQQHQQQQQRSLEREANDTQNNEAETTPRVQSEGRMHADESPSLSGRSPRRRSSRKSLRRRSSSSLHSSDHESNEPSSSSSTSHEWATGQRQVPDERTIDQDKRSEGDEEYSLPGARVKTDRKSIKDNSIVPSELSTPKIRKPHSSLTTSVGRSLPTVTGTPIPRPNIRTGAGGAQGNIKALSVAGRMQKASGGLSSGLSLSQKRPQPRGPSASLSSGSKPLSSSSSTGAAVGVLGNSSHINSTAQQPRSLSGGKPVGSSNASAANGASVVGSAGDPTKRNSLHAAFTSNEAVATGLASLGSNVSSA